AATAALLDDLYLHGLAEFAYRNKLDLAGRLRFPRQPEERGADRAGAPVLGLPRRTLIPIGGGKDSLVVIEAIRRAGGEGTVAWVGHSPLIAACAERTGMGMLNIGRELSPILLDYNRMGAWNSHIPLTVVNAA